MSRRIVVFIAALTLNRAAIDLLHKRMEFAALGRVVVVGYDIHGAAINKSGDTLWRSTLCKRTHGHGLRQMGHRFELGNFDQQLFRKRDLQGMSEKGEAE